MIWRDINTGRSRRSYQVSNTGQVRRLPSRQLMKTFTVWGNEVVDLHGSPCGTCGQSKKTRYAIKDLVRRAFADES